MNTTLNIVVQSDGPLKRVMMAGRSTPFFGLVDGFVCSKYHQNITVANPVIRPGKIKPGSFFLLGERPRLMANHQYFQIVFIP